MKLAEVIHQLDANAAGQKRIVMGPLRALAKQLKADHSLALALWATGRADARMLAAMVMAPDQLTAEQAESMLVSLEDPQLVDELVAVVAKSPAAGDLRQKWIRSQHALTARAGWSLLTREVLQKQLTSADCVPILATIDEHKRAVPTKTAESMMRCLVEIGVHFPEHRPVALDIGTRWGRIDDRPVSKGCTPFHAVEWIEAILRRHK